MGPRRASTACLVLALVAMPVTAGEASSVEADLTVLGRVHFQGDVNLTLQSTGIFHEVGAGDATLSIQTRGARLWIIDYPYTRIGTDSSHPIGERSQRENHPAQVIRDETFTGEILLLSSIVNASHRILPLYEDGFLSHQVSGRLDSWIREPQWPILPASHFGQARIEPSNAPEARDVRPPYGAWGIENTSLEGPAWVLLYGGEVVLRPEGEAQERVWTGPEEDPVSIQDPAGLHEADTMHRYVVIMEAQHATTNLQGAWVAAMQSAAGQWRGDFEFTAVQGESTVHGEPLPGDMDLLQVIGDVHATADYTDTQAAWRLQGDASFVGVDGVAVAGSRGLGLETVLVSSGLLLVLAAALSHVGREVLTFVFGYNVTRPYASRTRVEVLRTIIQQPGISRRGLEARHDVSRATIRHHVGVLQRARLITAHRVGKKETYTLNHGAFSPQAAKQVSLARHPTRTQILDALRGGEASYQDMVRHWRAQGAPGLRRDQVSYHGGILEEAGLVTRRRKGRNVVWRLNEAPSVVDVSATGRSADILGAVKATPGASPDEIVTALRGLGRIRKQDVTDAVNELYALGWIDQRDGRLYPI